MDLLIILKIFFMLGSIYYFGKVFFPVRDWFLSVRREEKEREERIKKRRQEARKRKKPVTQETSDEEIIQGVEDETSI